MISIVQHLQSRLSTFLSSTYGILFYSWITLSDLFIKLTTSIFGFFTAGFCQHSDYISLIRSSREGHEVVEALKNMINTDGAGTWPPQASHRDSWPASLQPYHDIFLDLAPLLPVDQICVNDAINQSRRIEYRTRLQKLLQERVDLAAVESDLIMSEDSKTSSLTSDGYNGFFACISTLRHAFRWGTVPIVKVAQQEKVINFPSELDLPWKFLRWRYGSQSPGGNTMSNFYCNFDSDGNLVYAVNRSMPEPIPSAEHNLIYSFTEPERKAVPIYYHIVQSILFYENGQKLKCKEHLKKVNLHLRTALRIYYENVIDSKIPRSVFTAYIQGFHGWAAGENVNGKYIEYDGISGAHLVLFNLLDLFLELAPFLEEQSFVNYIPSSQRKFIASVKSHAFRGEAKRAGDVEVVLQLEDMVKQLRTFRSAHRKRTSQYLNVHRPERVVMTAGASTLESGPEATVQDLVDSVDSALRAKLTNTK